MRFLWSVQTSNGSGCGGTPSWTRFSPKPGIPRSSNKTWGLKSKVLTDNYAYLFRIFLVLTTIRTVCFQYIEHVLCICLMFLCSLHICAFHILRWHRARSHVRISFDPDSDGKALWLSKKHGLYLTGARLGDSIRNPWHQQNSKVRCLTHMTHGLCALPGV